MPPSLFLSRPSLHTAWNWVGGPIQYAICATLPPKSAKVRIELAYGRVILFSVFDALHTVAENWDRKETCRVQGFKTRPQFLTSVSELGFQGVQLPANFYPAESSKRRESEGFRGSTNEWKVKVGNLPGFPPFKYNPIKGTLPTGPRFYGAPD